MKIAIIGTRGIPNHYGGFEQCAEYLAVGLTKKGFDVIVYNSHNHPYQKEEWNGVKIKHCFDPEFKLGAAGQFLYDLNCILDVNKQDLDVILQLGYTSSSVWGWLMPKNVVITTNMDGLEWKRSKYSKKVREFLRFAEKLGVKYSDHLISDSIGIQKYLKKKYNADSVYIPYGANVFTDPDPSFLANFSLTPLQYDLLIARLEPENSIEIILEGVAKAKMDRPFLVIGKHETKFGNYLKEKFNKETNIVFCGAIYDIQVLNNIRYFSNLYFHGHTVGGTNPSLLEAMASNSLICAHKNDFNESILGPDAFYFKEAKEVKKYLQEYSKSDASLAPLLENNKEKIRTIYSWENIIDQYAEHLANVKDMRKRGER